MPLRVPRRTSAALVLSLAFACLPACKKKKPPEPDTTPPAPAAGPSAPGPSIGFGANTNSWLPTPPRGPFFSSVSEAPMRLAAENDLKQILLAMHDYHDRNGGLPGGFADATGKPGLSWRVALLPHIGQDNLFKQFKLDEAWDGEHNRTLIDKMPKIYAPPRTSTNSHTFYRGFSGPNTWLPPHQGPAKPGQPLLGVKVFQIPDGSSNTILVAEAAEPVVWTKPDEMAFAPNNLPKIGGVFGSGTVVGMADGSVRFLRKSVSAQDLANAIQINDGMIVNLDN